jgi:hypothetical protein
MIIISFPWLPFISFAGFTSKFDLYHDDLFGFDVDDIDGSHSNSLFDMDETTSVDSLQQEKLEQPPPIEGPDFDYRRFRNVTLLVENTAYLKCFVTNIANKTVSWVRHRGINLLTVGTTSYTSDSRFQSIHDSDSDEWILKVRALNGF